MLKVVLKLLSVVIVAMFVEVVHAESNESPKHNPKNEERMRLLEREKTKE